VIDWFGSAVGSALTAALLLGISCGVLGTFVVARRMALTGDMLSHAVLPGVVAGLVWSTTRNPLVVLGCAVVAGWLGSVVMQVILRTTRLKPDAALALVLSVFFAVGIAMVSRYQPSGVQAFLFGQVAAIDGGDLKLLVWVTVVVLLLVPWGFRVLRLVSFDPAFARLLGFPVRWVEAGFFLMLTVVIVIAMQAVGVVLVSAMLVTPAAGARFWSRSLSGMVWVSCGLAVLGGMVGVWISSVRTGLPTGPLMALAVTVCFAVSAWFGPEGGWLQRRLRVLRERRRIAGEDVLKRMWHAEQAGGDAGGVSVRVMKDLKAREWVGGGGLTEAGKRHARGLVRAHRLWETYLTERAAFKPDHVHDEAERAEHWIDDEQKRDLAEKLGFPEKDPHGSPIPPDEGKGVAG
jgi:manganese/zinc/iron transport system permease protein